MRTMAELLAEDRAPAEIMNTYSARDAERGRNDPCSCGGGRKWKHRHGDTARTGLPYVPSTELPVVRDMNDSEERSPG
jgi:hypothetical protein